MAVNRNKLTVHVINLRRPSRYMIRGDPNATLPLDGSSVIVIDVLMLGPGTDGPHVVS